MHRVVCILCAIAFSGSINAFVRIIYSECCQSKSLLTEDWSLWRDGNDLSYQSFPTKGMLSNYEIRSSFVRRYFGPRVTLQSPSWLGRLFTTRGFLGFKSEVVHLALLLRAWLDTAFTGVETAQYVDLFLLSTAFGTLYDEDEYYTQTETVTKRRLDNRL